MITCSDSDTASSDPNEPFHVSHTHAPDSSEPRQPRTPSSAHITKASITGNPTQSTSMNYRPIRFSKRQPASPSSDPPVDAFGRAHVHHPLHGSSESKIRVRNEHDNAEEGELPIGPKFTDLAPAAPAAFGRFPHLRFLDNPRLDPPKKGPVTEYSRPGYAPLHPMVDGPPPATQRSNTSAEDAFPRSSQPLVNPFSTNSVCRAFTHFAPQSYDDAAPGVGLEHALPTTPFGYSYLDTAASPPASPSSNNEFHPEAPSLVTAHYTSPKDAPANVNHPTDQLNSQTTARLAASVASLDSTVQSLASTVATLSTKIDDIRTPSPAQSTDVAPLQDVISSLTRTVTALAAGPNGAHAYASKLDSLQAEVDGINTAIKSLRAEVAKRMPDVPATTELSDTVKRNTATLVTPANGPAAASMSMTDFADFVGALLVRLGMVQASEARETSEAIKADVREILAHQTSVPVSQGMYQCSNSTANQTQCKPQYYGAQGGSTSLQPPRAKHEPILTTSAYGGNSNDQAAEIARLKKEPADTQAYLKEEREYVKFLKDGLDEPTDDLEAAYSEDGMFMFRNARLFSDDDEILTAQIMVLDSEKEALVDELEAAHRAAAEQEAVHSLEIEEFALKLEVERREAAEAALSSHNDRLLMEHLSSENARLHLEKESLADELRSARRREAHEAFAEEDYVTALDGEHWEAQAHEADLEREKESPVTGLDISRESLQKAAAAFFREASLLEEELQRERTNNKAIASKVL